ncbi:hypothetical protein CR969_02685 [Candidatus Saccharibacteria bacterium]|nr:MAG: hypothetical protein CR969_02685 [Candidatus Saccharibacteria bacterium]
MKFREGFSAIELMVTLAIAVLFIMSGYQLFAAATNRTGNARELSVASNVAYTLLREEGSGYVNVTEDCTAPQNSVFVKTTNLPAPVKIELKRCKPIAGSPIVKVWAVVTYGDPAKEVVHGTYVAP